MTMRNCSSYSVTFCILFLFLNSYASITFVEEPTNTTVCEGREVNISCTYNGANTVPVWYINDTVYDWFHIPRPHMLKWLVNGAQLRIENISLEINATKYQCGFPFEGSLRSTVGVIYIDSRWDQACSPITPTSLSLRFSNISASDVLAITSSRREMKSELDFPNFAYEEKSSSLYTARTLDNSYTTPRFTTPRSQEKYNLIITLPTVVVSAVLISCAGVFIFIVHQKVRGKISKNDEGSQSQDHMYEEIRTQNEQPPDVTDMTCIQDENKLKLYKNQSYETVLNSGIKLDKCLAYESVKQS